MPTILELFRGSTFDTDVDSKSQEGKGTLFSQVKSFGEQEATGIRVKSAVELNNPLIYGNEATRIALRSTPSLDKMRTDEGEEYELVMTEEKTIEVKNGKILKNEALYKSMNLMLSKLDYFYEDMEDDAIIETDGFHKEDDSKGESCIVFSMVGTSTISEYVEEKEDDSSSGPDGWEDDPRFK